MARPRPGRFLIGLAVGAAAAFLFDPRLGRRRRAIARGKLGRYGRAVMAWPGARLRSATGPAQGLMHEAARHAPWHEAPPPPDQDQFIKQRVESELGRHGDLPLADLNFDAADALVRVRGTVADEETARRVVERVAAVEGVKAVLSLMHTPDGAPVGGQAGDRSLLYGPPRAAVHADGVRKQLMERWPALTDADILASDGHVERLAAVISRRAGVPEAEARAALDEIVLAAI